MAQLPTRSSRRNLTWSRKFLAVKILFNLACISLLCSCGTTTFKPYDRTKIAKGFTQTEDALADAKKYTQDAKDQVRKIKTNSQLIDNKAGVILNHWNDAR